MPDARRAAKRQSHGAFGVVLRAVAMLVALSALGVATVTWVDLSRPFDPPRLAPLAVAGTPTEQPGPTYPGAVTVVTYHDVSDEDSSTKTLTRRTFAEHLATLSALGYQTVPLATVRDLVRHKPVRLPERPMLLTFDGGSLTTWTTVDPVLERYHYTAVAFLTTDLLVEPGTPSHFLSTRQVTQLAGTGRWEFGSRTAGMDKLAPVRGDVQAPLTNRIVTGAGEENVEQWRARVTADLTRSRQRLRELTGTDAYAFSYPFADAGHGSNVEGIGTELPALLERNGFDIAFVGENVPTGHIDAVTESSPRWLLPRIGVRRTTTPAGLLDMIRDATPTPMPARLTDLKWTADDAKCDVTPEDITVQAAPGVYGMCGLTGVNTSRWLNYAVDLTVTGISSGTSAAVGVRDGAGAGHYGRVEVLIGANRMVIRQRVGSGSLEELRTAPLPSGTERTVHIEVHASTVAVRIDDEPTVAVKFDRRLHEGGLTLARVGEDSLTFQKATLTNNSAP